MLLKHKWLTVRLAGYWYRRRTAALEKLVFTATTGRSGTLTLARLFAAIPGCASFHEPYPVMNGPILKAASYGDTALVNRIYRQMKSINILRSAVGHRYYVEANHLFIKTFAPQAIQEFGSRLAIIHLVRHPLEVAVSIFRLQDYPGTEVGNGWWLDYKAPTNRIQIAETLEHAPKFSHPLYRALWYWYEMEARISALRDEMPALKIVRFETAWLNDKRKVFGLLDELKIDYQEAQLEALIGCINNAREHHKAILAPPKDESQSMLDRFEELLEDHGVDLSAMRAADIARMPWPVSGNGAETGIRV